MLTKYRQQFNSNKMNIKQTCDLDDYFFISRAKKTFDLENNM